MKYGSNGCEMQPSVVSSHLARQGERGSASKGVRGGAYKVEVGSATPPTGHYADAGLPSAKHIGPRPDETGN